VDPNLESPLCNFFLSGGLGLEPAGATRVLSVCVRSDKWVFCAEFFAESLCTFDLNDSGAFGKVPMFEKAILLKADGEIISGNYDGRVRWAKNLAGKKKEPNNPLSPPSAPVQWRLLGPPAKSKFLAV
jgi:hypothetical protein